MSNWNLTIDLKSRRDKDGQTFYIGKIKGPVLIDCSEGASFLIFVSEQGAEQLQIAPMENNKDKNDADPF